jgi:hypothetical protein
MHVRLEIWLPPFLEKRILTPVLILLEQLPEHSSYICGLLWSLFFRVGELSFSSLASASQQQGLRNEAAAAGGSTLRYYYY